MPAVPLNILLEKNLLPNESLSVPYPPGKTEGNFFGSSNHTMGVDASFFRAPRDFIILPQPDRIILRWHGQHALRGGSLLNIMLDEPGSDFYHDPKAGITILNMVASQMFLANLGAPRNAIGDFYVTVSKVAAQGALPLTGNAPNTPRTVVVHASEDNAERVFRIEGEDLYGRSMAEEITGPAGEAETSEGKKAFAKVTRITVDAACKGEIAVGTGNTFGLPVFLPAPGFVMRVLINGEETTDGIIESGESGLPGPRTKDRRGTYTPPTKIALNGQKAIFVLLSLPNPANIGIPDYAG